MAKIMHSRNGAKDKGMRALGCLLLVGTLLALSFVIAKFADDSGAPRLSFLMIALLGAGFVLMALSALRGYAKALDRRMVEYALVTGVLLTLPNALGFLAVRHVGAGFLSMSFAFPVLVTWLIAVLIGLERLRWRRLLGVLLGLSGGALLAMSKAFAGDVAPGWAALILALPLSLALGNIYRTLRWPEGAEPIYLAALMLIVAAVALLPFALLAEPGRLPELIGSTATIMLLLAELAVFSVLYVFYFVLQKIAGPVYLSQMGTVAAVVGTLIAIFGLGESPPNHFGIAVSLVAVGTVIFHRSAAPSTPNKSPAHAARQAH